MTSGSVDGAIRELLVMKKLNTKGPQECPLRNLEWILELLLNTRLELCVVGVNDASENSSRIDNFN